MINEEEFRKAFPNIREEFVNKYFKKKNYEAKASEPSILKQAISFGKAALKHIANGFRNVEKEVYKKRIKMCEVCERFALDTRKCNECGCYVDTKASWASEECPLKKWLKVNSKNKGCGCSSTGQTGQT